MEQTNYKTGDVLSASTINQITEAIANNNSYSTFPQQIGTWIDGTPIWRVGFSKTFAELGEEENIQLDQEVQITSIFAKVTSIPISQLNSCFIIRQYYAQGLNSNKNVVDDYVLNVENQEINGFFTGTEYHKTMYGVIEFVAPQSVINSIPTT